MSNLRRTEKTVKGKVVILNYPTLLDDALIETDIFVNSRGYAHIMAGSTNEKSVEAANLIIALTHLKFCVTFKDGKDLLDWNKIYEDDSDFVKECFKVFSEWRSSFREGSEGTNKGKLEEDSKE